MPYLNQDVIQGWAQRQTIPSYGSEGLMSREVEIRIVRHRREQGPKKESMVD